MSTPATDITERLAIDREARTVDLIFSSGADLLRSDGAGRPYLLQLSLEEGACDLRQMKTGRVALYEQHRAGWEGAEGEPPLDLVLGVVIDAWIEDGRRAFARARFGTSPRAEERWQMVLDGVLVNCSARFGVHAVRDVTTPGDELRRLLATRWEPRLEVSFVHAGADAGACIAPRPSPAASPPALP